jgi:branched-chain amino acid transport system permease protein
MLGLIESYGIALFGTTYRNLFAFVLLIGFLLWLPRSVRRTRRLVDRAAHR